MSETESEPLLQQLDTRISALSAAEKRLKKLSTIPFVERRDLSNKAARAAEELRTRRGEIEGSEITSAAEGSEELRAALEVADRVLGQIEGAQPAGFKRTDAAASRAQMGHGRRSMGGMSSQQRSPDRIGGE